ncbi:hypothetical protein D3C77_679040 [compost metagenome]
MELVGGFEIRKGKSIYRTEVNGILREHSSKEILEGAPIQLMPLAHELLFNVLRERSDRYTAVAQVMRKSPEPHIRLLQLLLTRNVWEAKVVASVAELLDAPELYKQWLQEQSGDV